MLVVCKSFAKDFIVDSAQCVRTDAIEIFWEGTMSMIDYSNFLLRHVNARLMAYLWHSSRPKPDKIDLLIALARKTHRLKFLHLSADGRWSATNWNLPQLEVANLADPSIELPVNAVI